VELSHDILDVQSYTVSGQRPAMVIKRAATSLWLVREQPVGIENANAWSWANAGEFVRIPLHPYLTPKQDPATALAYAYQLGFRARDAVGDVGVIDRLHMVLGSPVEELHDGSRALGFRFWLGFAVSVMVRRGA
jgi:hypothetical protein